MLVAAYGTLRGGQHSARFLTHRHGKDSVKEVRTEVVEDYGLYHAWRYGFDCPFAVKEKGKKITVTILEIADGAAANDIDDGESWGYDKTPIGNGVFMYVANAQQANSDDLEPIASGDWLRKEA